MTFLSKYLTPTILDQTFKMYVRPHLDYGDVIFLNQLTDMMDSLESIQYQAGLVVSNCWKGTNKDKLYKELGWESLAHKGELLGIFHFTIRFSMIKPPVI